MKEHGVWRPACLPAQRACALNRRLDGPNVLLCALCPRVHWLSAAAVPSMPGHVRHLSHYWSELKSNWQSPGDARIPRPCTKTSYRVVSTEVYGHFRQKGLRYKNFPRIPEMRLVAEVGGCANVTIADRVGARTEALCSGRARGGSVRAFSQRDVQGVGSLFRRLSPYQW
jgi:hypothetical protein